MSLDAPLWHVCLPDLHVPYQDPTALAVALAAVRALRPGLHGITWLGDVADASPWSAHPRRSLAESPATHADEMTALRRVLVDARKAAGPRAKRVVLEGNHEARIVRELLRIGRPDLIALCDPATVMRESGYHVVPYAAAPQQHVIWTTATGRKAVACHGSYEGANAARSHARARHWRGHLVVFGHVHRRQHHVEIDRDGTRLEALTPGCLSGLAPAWVAPRLPEWDHGIAVLRLSQARIDAWTCRIECGALTLPDGREVRA